MYSGGGACCAPPLCFFCAGQFAWNNPPATQLFSPVAERVTPPPTVDALPLVPASDAGLRLFTLASTPEATFSTSPLTGARRPLVLMACDTGRVSRQTFCRTSWCCAC